MMSQQPKLLPYGEMSFQINIATGLTTSDKNLKEIDKHKELAWTIISLLAKSCVNVSLTRQKSAMSSLSLQQSDQKKAQEPNCWLRDWYVIKKVSSKIHLEYSLKHYLNPDKQVYLNTITSLLRYRAFKERINKNMVALFEALSSMQTKSYKLEKSCVKINDTYSAMKTQIAQQLPESIRMQAVYKCIEGEIKAIREEKQHKQALQNSIAGSVTEFNSKNALEMANLRSAEEQFNRAKSGLVPDVPEIKKERAAIEQQNVQMQAGEAKLSKVREDKLLVCNAALDTLKNVYDELTVQIDKCRQITTNINSLRLEIKNEKQEAIRFKTNAETDSKALDHHRQAGIQIKNTKQTSLKSKALMNSMKEEKAGAIREKQEVLAIEQARSAQIVGDIQAKRSYFESTVKLIQQGNFFARAKSSHLIQKVNAYAQNITQETNDIYNASDVDTALKSLTRDLSRMDSDKERKT